MNGVAIPHVSPRPAAALPFAIVLRPLPSSFTVFLARSYFQQSPSLAWKKSQRLRASGELLRQAGDLRALIGGVRDAVRAGSLDVDDATLRAWEEWASAEADRLDPILSGQIMTHLAQRDEMR